MGRSLSATLELEQRKLNAVSLVETVTRAQELSNGRRGHSNGRGRVSTFGGRRGNAWGSGEDDKEVMAMLGEGSNFEGFGEKVVPSSKAKLFGGLSISHFRDVFRRKCKTLGVQATPEREDRFVKVMAQHASGGALLLEDMGLSAPSARVITRALAHDTHYAGLSFKRNILGDTGAAHVAKLLKVNTTIVQLGLQSNNIGVAGTVALFGALESNNTLTSLDMSGISGVNRNHIGCKGAEAVARALQRNPVLDTLLLQENGLGRDGAICIAPSLASCGSLRVLDLAANAMGTDGVYALAGHLAHSNLKRLVLARNQISDPAIIALGGALAGAASSVTLEYLDVSENALTHRCCTALSNVVAAGSLTHLNVARNSLASRGAKTLAPVLASSMCKVKTLILDYNGIGSEGGMELATYLARARSLLTLQLSHNPLGPSAISAIFRALTPPEDQAGAMGGLRDSFRLGGGGRTPPVHSRPHSPVRPASTTFFPASPSTPLNGSSVMEGGVAVSMVVPRPPSPTRPMGNQGSPLRRPTSPSRSSVGGGGASVLAAAAAVSSPSTTPHRRASSVFGGSSGVWCRSLQKLGVRKCDMNDDVRGAIVTLISRSVSLQHLDVSDNEYSDPVGSALVDATKTNHTLLTLNTSLNPMGYVFHARVQSLVARNRRVYQGQAVDRARERLEDLRDDEVRLHVALEEIGDQQDIIGELNAKMESETITLESVKRHRDSVVAELEAELGVVEGDRELAERASTQMAQTLGRLKNDLETRLRLSMQKLHREQEAINRLEQRIRLKSNDISDLGKTLAPAMMDTREKLNAARMDKDASEAAFKMEAHHLQNQKVAWGFAPPPEPEDSAGVASKKRKRKPKRGTGGSSSSGRRSGTTTTRRKPTASSGLSSSASTPKQRTGSSSRRRPRPKTSSGSATGRSTASPRPSSSQRSKTSLSTANPSRRSGTVTGGSRRSAGRIGRSSAAGSGLSSTVVAGKVGGSSTVPGAPLSRRSSRGSVVSTSGGLGDIPPTTMKHSSSSSKFLPRTASSAAVAEVGEFGVIASGTGGGSSRGVGSTSSGGFPVKMPPTSSFNGGKPIMSSSSSRGGTSGPPLVARNSRSSVGSGGETLRREPTVPAISSLHGSGEYGAAGATGNGLEWVAGSADARIVYEDTPTPRTVRQLGNPHVATIGF